MLSVTVQAIQGHAGIGLIFGGWWFLSAKNWFKGPVRMSEEEMLERERAYQGEPGISPAGK